jgi:WXXGXW repeat (2 copies)
MQFSSSIRKVLVAATLTLIPAASFAGVLVSVNIAPPALPVYTQPLCPGDGYLWTPGYWAWGPEGYYWVPGVWVQPPTVGVLWTPGYWGWGGGAYIFHAGYWGPHIGFYGGVNYGFGYGGVGYEGGYWNHGAFAYNRSVNNINVVNVHNVYNKTVIVNNNYSRVSYNGGAAGIRAQESVQERSAFHEQHFQPTVNQQSHEQFARQDRTQLASVNNGRPQMAAARTPEEYHSVVQQHGSNINNNRANVPQANQRPAYQQNTPQARPQAQAYSQQSHPQPQNYSQPQNHEQPREQPHPQPQNREQPREQPQPHAQPQQHQGGNEHAHPEGHEGKGGR